MAARLQAFRHQTTPILPHYQAQGRLFDIDGMAGIDVVSAAIDAAIREATHEDLIPRD